MKQKWGKFRYSKNKLDPNLGRAKRWHCGAFIFIWVYNAITYPNRIGKLKYHRHDKSTLENISDSPIFHFPCPQKGRPNFSFAFRLCCRPTLSQLACWAVGPCLTVANSTMQKHTAAHGTHRWPLTGIWQALVSFKLGQRGLRKLLIDKTWESKMASLTVMWSVWRSA